MKICITVMALTALTWTGMAADYSKFPDWAESVLQNVDLKSAPEDSKLWVFLDELNFTMKSNGKLQVERRYLRYVVRAGGADDASIYVVLGNEDDTRVKSVKGWHQNASGVMDKLNKKDTMTLGTSSSEMLTRDTATFAYFSDVDKGSIVAFESEEVGEGFFPMRYFPVLNEDPIKKMTIRAASDNGQMTPVVRPLGFENWDLKMEKAATQVTLMDLPAIDSEIYTPGFDTAYPMVQVAFDGPQTSHLASWDQMAKWYVGLFRRSSGIQSVGQPAKTLDEVATLINNVTQKISYRQRYLSVGRGWVPAAGADVERRAYGDCKDMVACMAFAGSRKNVTVYPVMANIADGPFTNEASTPGPVFNHLIAAVALEKSLGLPAEIEVDGKLYLIVDPTSSHTPVGYLPDYFQGRDVMLCLEDAAHWLTIPDKALEPGSLTIALKGTLDDVFSLKGSMEVTEKGDAYGLRTTLREYNPVELEGFLRWQLDLPGYMTLKSVSQEEVSENELKLTYQVSWPSFLMRDAGGLRLPHAVIGRPVRTLARQGKSRQMPIYLDAQPETVWQIQVRCKTPLSPGATEEKWQDDHRSFSWKAEGGSSLQIHYASRSEKVYFTKSDLEDGLAYWKAYRDAFNPFVLSGATLSIGE